MPRIIYLDNNATTRPSDAVVSAMSPFFSERFFNPGTLAGEVDGVSQTIADARSALANHLGGHPDQWFFTSGATEANNWALRGACRIAGDDPFHLVVSSIEHASVLETAHDLDKSPNVRLDVVPVDSNGLIDRDALRQLLTQQTQCVSLMAANNESGVVQPIDELSALIKSVAPFCLLHVDATQAIGKLPVDLDGALQHVDLLSLSAHKFHGPKGVGALFIRNTEGFPPLITGGGQQQRLRSGTENPALIAGLATALESVASPDAIERYQQHVSALRDAVERGIRKLRPDTQVLSSIAPRLVNTSMVVLPGADAEFAQLTLFNRGLIVATGSACTSGTDIPSHVLLAQGVPITQCRNALRISFSVENTMDDVDALLAAMNTL